MQRFLLAVFFCLAQFAGVAAFAADSAVDVTMQAFKVVTTAKGVELVPTTEAKPGDTIEYQVAYRNRGAEAARQVIATLPVPAAGMAYIPDTAAPAAVMASLDGKEFAPVPLQRTVLREGRRVTETVPPAEYRFLRWTIGELRAGQTTTVKSRMRLNGAGDRS
ncbi:putative repeat protein (TIGR01451 family) [Pseudoduganella lurida]|uniref:Putative repeat protein (TIGR01451 family) n=1 Tax=Pseudoduganella lurida TaxID=1036180 RepID=A0A562RKZ3_9BURK|nr:DUF11 domain-containing protein [Pseudoduganella lurida]TWI69722.1 putative repeat protein (TIGR01451 family) [Pseudoduganella lurida]